MTLTLAGRFSERSVHPLTCDSVSSAGLLWSRIGADMVVLTVQANLRSPLLGCATPRRALKAGFAIDINASVSDIFRACGKPKIASPVVQAVTVNVVNLHVCGRARNGTMQAKHANPAIGSVAALCVNGPDRPVAAIGNGSGPVPPVNYVQIGHVNDGDVPTCKRDESVIAFNPDRAYFSVSHDRPRVTVSVRPGRGGDTPAGPPHHTSRPQSWQQASADGCFE